MRWHEFLFGVIVLFINKATSSRVTDLFKAVKCFIAGIAVHGSHAGITVYVVFVIVAIELNNEFFAAEVTDMFHFLYLSNIHRVTVLTVRFNVSMLPTAIYTAEFTVPVITVSTTIITRALFFFHSTPP